MSKIIETYDSAYRSLQQKYAGQIEVVEAPQIVTPVDIGSRINHTDSIGFTDISARVADLAPLYGKVVLSLDRRNQQYSPAVITRKGNTIQMTVLRQPYDPKVGPSDGILFALGLKVDTNNPSFGAHTASKGFEAGHFAPAMIGIVTPKIKAIISNEGDKGTHAVGADVGGIPEKMIQSGLMNNMGNLVTRELDPNQQLPIPLYWHPSLESNDGPLNAHYEGPTSAIKLMLGSASLALGPERVDTVGTLTDISTRGA